MPSIFSPLTLGIREGSYSSGRGGHGNIKSSKQHSKDKDSQPHGHGVDSCTISSSNSSSSSSRATMRPVVLERDPHIVPVGREGPDKPKPSFRTGRGGAGKPKMVDSEYLDAAKHPQTAALMAEYQAQQVQTERELVSRSQESSKCMHSTGRGGVGGIFVAGKLARSSDCDLPSSNRNSMLSTTTYTSTLATLSTPDLSFPDSPTSPTSPDSFHFSLYSGSDGSDSTHSIPSPSTQTVTPPKKEAVKVRGLWNKMLRRRRSSKVSPASPTIHESDENDVGSMRVIVISPDHFPLPPPMDVDYYAETVGVAY